MLKNFPGQAGPEAVVYILPQMTAFENTGWNTLTVDASCMFGGYKATASTAAQTNSISFRATLMQGTWTFETLYVKSTNAGVLDLALDGTSAGTQDSYAASISRNNFWTLTGVAVTYSGLHTLTYTTATKNASSTGYGGYLQAIKLSRTG